MAKRDARGAAFPILSGFDAERDLGERDLGGDSGLGMEIPRVRKALMKEYVMVLRPSDKSPELPMTFSS